jgi:hypothetical protein
MDDPAEPDRDPREPAVRGADGPAGGLTENDLDIDELVPVWRDDALVDALTRVRSGDGLQELAFDVSADRELIETLLLWRESTAERVDRLEESDRAEPRRQPGRLLHRVRLPLASLATAVVVAAVAMSAYVAEPDKPLWTVTQILYSDHAESVQAAYDVRRDLDSARAALTAGQRKDAGTALAAAAARIPAVHGGEGRSELEDSYRSVAAQLRTVPRDTTKKAGPNGGRASDGPIPHAVPEGFVDRPDSPRQHMEPSALGARGAGTADGPTSRSDGTGDRSEGGVPEGRATASAPHSREDGAAGRKPDTVAPRPSTEAAPASPSEEGEAGRTARRHQVEGGRILSTSWSDPSPSGPADVDRRPPPSRLRPSPPSPEVPAASTEPGSPPALRRGDLLPAERRTSSPG